MDKVSVVTWVYFTELSTDKVSELTWVLLYATHFKALAPYHPFYFKIGKNSAIGILPPLLF